MMAEEDSQTTNARDTDEESTAGPGKQLESSVENKDLPGAGLKRLLGISLPITVEVGRVRITIEQLLELGSGSIIELNKMAGEPAELYVRNAKFALGEIVVVDDNFGLRITEILDQQECPDGLQR